MNILIIFSTLLISITPAHALFDSLPKNKRCVAYKTSKTMFFIKSVEILGKNCQIKVKLSKDKEQLLVEIPVDAFNSGDNDRDKEVAIIVGGENKSPLIFKAKIQDITVNKLKEKFKGTLTVKGLEKPIEFNSKILETGLWQLKLETSFSSFGIDAPSVAGGVVAKAKDSLTLIGQIPVSEIYRLVRLRDN